MSSQPSPDVGALVEQFFQRRREGRRISVDDVLSESGGSGDALTRSALISNISWTFRLHGSSFRTQDSHVAASSIAASMDVVLPDLPSYDLIEEIGRGGMGVVYEAYQKSTGRRVAVKLISEQIAASDGARRRFEREVELIARLTHPNIVSVVDSGVHHDRCFCVMDYIDGRTLDVFLGEIGNSQRPEHRIKEVLRLLATICDGVEYAHQRGVLHRDLKPTNILIDQRGEPHVLDFGLAKDIGPLALAQRGLTIAEPGQVLGTLAYMAPEQARGAHDQTSVRSDVYSLGAIAYEAVTGRLPCETSGDIQDVLDRIQRLDPPRPSKLVHGIPADVDAILLKALEKDPQRRYATVGDLAGDLRHFLSDEPISARPGGSFYQFRKFARRNKLAVSFAGTVFLAVTILAVAMTIQSGRIARERDNARTEAKKADEVSGFLTTILTSVNPDKAEGQDTTLVRRMLAEASERVDRELVGFPEVQADVYATIGNTYYSIGLYDLAGPHLQRALALRREVFGTDHERVARSMRDLGQLAFVRGKYTEAEDLLRAALEMYRKVGVDRQSEVASCLVDLATIFQSQSRFQEGEPLYEEAIAILRPGEESHPERLSSALLDLANLQNGVGKYEKAESLAREALDIMVKRFGDKHWRVVYCYTSLAKILHNRAKYTETEHLSRKALEIDRPRLGENHPDLATLWHNHGAAVADEGKFDEAEKDLRESLRIRRKSLGPEHHLVADTLNSLGNVLSRKGDFAAAESVLREAVAISRKTLDPANPDLAATLNNLAGVLWMKDDCAGTAAMTREALDVFKKRLGGEHPSVASTMHLLALALECEGDLEGAEVNMLSALAIRRKRLGQDHPQVADSLRDLGRILVKKGDTNGAESFFAESVLVDRRIPGSGKLALGLWYLAQMQKRNGKLDKAEQSYLESLELYHKLRGEENSDVADALHALGTLHLLQERWTTAEKYLDDAVKIRSKVLGEKDADTLASVSALAELYEKWNTAEPGKGHQEKAAEWREKLEKSQATTQPNAIQTRKDST